MAKYAPQIDAVAITCDANCEMCQSRFELSPPYVQTELTGVQQASDPRAMPLDQLSIGFVAVKKSSRRRVCCF